MKQKSSKRIPRTRSKTLIGISRVASFIFHPLFMTAFTAVVLHKLVPDEFLQLSSPGFGRWIGELLMYTVLFPFASILLLRLSGLISNARMHEARDRILPLIATMIFYILAYCFFAYKHPAPVLLQSLLLGSSCAIVILFIVNLFYKVSVHTAAAAILPGMGILLILDHGVSITLPLVLALLIALFVGIIRWLLGAHTIGQIVLGYIIGISTQLGAYFIGKF
jgi:hypothetical protein